jgi:hypothetical protein
MLQFNLEKLDAAGIRGVKREHLDWSIDLHVYVLLLSRAPHEPLRQWFSRMRVDDHNVI